MYTHVADHWSQNVLGNLFQEIQGCYIQTSGPVYSFVWQDWSQEAPPSLGGGWSHTKDEHQDLPQGYTAKWDRRGMSALWEHFKSSHCL